MAVILIIACPVQGSDHIQGLSVRVAALRENHLPQIFRNVNHILHKLTWIFENIVVHPLQYVSLRMIVFRAEGQQKGVVDVPVSVGLGFRQPALCGKAGNDLTDSVGDKVFIQHVFS